MSNNNSKLVYSTEQVIPKPGKHREKKSIIKVPQTGLRSLQQTVTVRLDRKSRGGKSVTIIEGLVIPPQGKGELLRQLKAGLGTGGALKDTSLEIQGDHRDVVIAALEKRGHRPKRSGG